MIDIIYRK